MKNQAQIRINKHAINRLQLALGKQKPAKIYKQTK